jgi:thiopurine S-methyltransferase
MELSYWQSRWRKGNIGFHMDQGYPGLKRNWAKLNMPERAIVLVPLCGKSTDMDWLAQRVETVIGVETAEEAISQYFTERKLNPDKAAYSGFDIYRAGNIELWLGDFFKFPENRHSGYDLIYDKASLVALPKEMRIRYAKKILALSAGNTRYLLHHFLYDSSEMSGPPFMISVQEIEELFSNKFSVMVLEEQDLDISKYPKFKLRGLNRYLSERLLLLTPK